MRDQKQLEKVEISTIRIGLQQMMQDVHGKLHPGLPWQKQHSIRSHFTSKLNLNPRKKLVKCHIWSIASYDTGT